MKNSLARLSNAVADGNFKQRLVNHLNDRAENIRKTPDPETSVGVFTLIAMTLIIGAIAWHFGGFTDAFHNLGLLVTGHVADITRGGNVLPTALAVICCMLGFSIISAKVVTVLAGDTQGEHAIAKELSKQSAGSMFGNLLFVVGLEELFARGLFLGLLTLIPGFGGTVGFYAMFLLGNFLWAAVHLTNFADPRDRNILRVLPQFLGGVCITMVYVKFGFWTGLAVHLGFDALLFGVHKAEKITRRDFVIVGYATVLAAFSYFMMSKPLADLSPWFSGGLTGFKIPGWQFWDYVYAHLFLTSAFTILAGLLLLDRPYVSRKASTAENKPYYWLLIPAGVVVGIALLFGGFWATGFLTHSLDIRISIIALLIAATQRGRSGSSVARTFWVSIPTTFITICALEAVGFWAAVGIVCVEFVFRLPQHFVEKAAHAEETQVYDEPESK